MKTRQRENSESTNVNEFQVDLIKMRRTLLEGKSASSMNAIAMIQKRTIVSFQNCKKLKLLILSLIFSQALCCRNISRAQFAGPSGHQLYRRSQIGWNDLNSIPEHNSKDFITSPYNLKSNELKSAKNVPIGGSSIASRPKVASSISSSRINNLHRMPGKMAIAIDGAHTDKGSRRQYLPNGPPPFRPSMLMMGAASSGVLDKLKRTAVFKRVYKSKVYYLFLDVLRQLTLLVDKISRRKVTLTTANMEAIQSVVNKLAWKGGHALKLKWPLVLLNPHFLKELLSTPTFLVMLFNAVEVAYMSMPTNFWLKPLMKLVQQASPEKEEQIWWRRKRLYDTLNGHGSSELQPNLKTIHFRSPGEPTPVAFPSLVSLARKFAKKPAPNPAYYKHPFPTIGSNHHSHPLDITTHQKYPKQPVQHDIDFESTSISNEHTKDNLYMSNKQAEAFLANQIKAQNNEKESLRTTLVEDDWHNQIFESNLLEHQHRQQSPYSVGEASSNVGIKLDYQGDWWSQLPSSQDQQMSQSEFDSLDLRDKELVMREARKRFEESKWASELIKQYSDFVESLTSGQHQPIDLMSMHDGRPYLMERSRQRDNDIRWR